MTRAPAQCTAASSSPIRLQHGAVQCVGASSCLQSILGMHCAAHSARKNTCYTERGVGREDDGKGAVEQRHQARLQTAHMRSLLCPLYSPA